eukprot:2295038-Pyramimonas_sp.AAC.1
MSTRPMSAFHQRSHGTNHPMCAQVHCHATLNGAGRGTSRGFHVIQKCLGARRRATPPLGGGRLSGGSRAHPLTQRLSAG